MGVANGRSPWLRCPREAALAEAWAAMRAWWVARSSGPWIFGPTGCLLVQLNLFLRTEAQAQHFEQRAHGSDTIPQAVVEADRKRFALSSASSIAC